MSLTFQTLPDHVIEEGDFSKFVAETYGRPFRYQQMELITNNSYIEFDVDDNDTSDGWVTDYAEPQIAEWLAEWEALKDSDDTFKDMHAEREHFIDLEVLTWDLHRRGLIPAGSYLMTVSW